jgi:hypothetical protein
MLHIKYMFMGALNMPEIIKEDFPDGCTTGSAYLNWITAPAWANVSAVYAKRSGKRC